MSKSKILIVEDENIIAMELEHRLSQMGYEVVASVSNGEAALKKIETKLPHVVLMDINIKGPKDGIEMAEEIRARFDIPVIFLTAYADEATLQRAKTSGSFGYLLKPFREEEMRAAIEMAMYNHKANIKLRRQAIIDSLTGLYNRRYLNEFLPREIHRAQRAGAQVSVAMLDFDHFKSLNDTYGHEAGDYVLKMMAGLIRGILRKSDLVCRYGGEEFTVILPDTMLEDATSKIEDACKVIRETTIFYNDIKLGVTASAGLASFPQHARSAKGLLRAADQALYRAKQSGRDQVCVAQKAS